MSEAGSRKRFKGSHSQQEGPMAALFAEYALQLDQVNERRERIVKASRDVTMQSKKVIFQLHRADPASPSAGIEQAEKSLEAVKSSHLARVAQELQGMDYWKYRRAYSPGMQEYVEAAAFLNYLKRGGLLSLAELNDSLASLKDAGGQSFCAPVEDYLLGLLDTTGELMRLAVSSAAQARQDTVAEVRTLLRTLQEAFRTLPGSSALGRDLPKKLEVMLQSLVKVENASYMIKVRGSEYPQDFLGSSPFLEGQGDRSEPGYGDGEF